MTEPVLGDGAGVVDLVTEDDKRYLGQLLHGEEGVKLSLGLGEALLVLGIDKEYDAVDFGEVISPDTAGYCERELRSAIFLFLYICKLLLGGG